MTSAVRQLLDQAASLGPMERAELVNELLSSLNPPNESVDAAWRSEAASRLAAWRKGELQDEPIDDVFQRINRDHR